MCSPGRGNFCAYDWNDLPIGREFEEHFLKKTSNPYALHDLPSPAGFTLIGALQQDNCHFELPWLGLGAQETYFDHQYSKVFLKKKKRCSQNNNNNKKVYIVICKQRIKNNPILKNPNLGWP